MTQHDTSAGTTTEQSSGFSHAPTNNGWVGWAALVVRRRRMVVLGPFVVTLLAIAAILLWPKRYTTTVTFSPVASDAPSAALSGLAGQFGVTLPTADASTSPDFYADLLQSDVILLKLARHAYSVVDGTDTLRGNFTELYEIDEGDLGKSWAESIRILRTKIVTVSFDRQTAVVQVDVRTKWRDLSVQMAAELLRLVDDFNRRSRRTRAGEEQKFLRVRRDTAVAELRRAEDSLQSFLVRNRAYQNDPVLVFAFNRLQRETTLRQEVYSTLTQAYEQSRLAAVRNTPSVTVIQDARPALRFDRRHTLEKAIAVLFVSIVAVLILLTIEQVLLRARTDAPDDYSELRAFAESWISRARRFRMRQGR